MVCVNCGVDENGGVVGRGEGRRRASGDFVGVECVEDDVVCDGGV